MFVYTNPNPQGSFVGDCVIRAIAIASNKSWYDVFTDLAVKALEMSDMPSSNRVWAEYLKDEGWHRYIVPDLCPHCYTIKDFASEHFRGNYIVGTGTHAVAVVNGDVMDTWNSENEYPLFYFTKEEE